MAHLIHSLRVGGLWPPNVADSVTPFFNSASAERRREAGRDVIPGVPPYLAGRGTDYYIFRAFTEE